MKKLHPPIVDLISTTPAVSLLYECVHTCIIGGMLQGASGYALAQTCVTKLAAFLEDSDQNRKSSLANIPSLLLFYLVYSKIHLFACSCKDSSNASTPNSGVRIADSH